MALQNDWHNLLIDKTIAQDHQVLYHTQIPIPRIEKFESVIVSGLLIRAVSILDLGLKEYITANGIEVQNNASLFHRLEVLSDVGRLVDHGDIDQWRLRRNQVGHEVTEIYTWDELNSCLNSIFRELHNLDILTDYPDMGIKRVAQRIDPPTIAGASIQINHTITVYDSGSNEAYLNFGWVQHVGGAAN